MDIEEILSKPQQNSYCCIVFDVSNFKFINDTFGFDIGDNILKIVSSALVSTLSKEKMDSFSVSRLHSDYFSVFLSTDSEDYASNFIENVIKKIHFSDEYKLDLYLGRYFSKDKDTAIDILENTSLAHAKAREGVVNTFFDYTEVYKSQISNEAFVRNNIEDAIKNREFHVFLQPKVFLSTDKICGVEALSRWMKNGQYIYPDAFIPALEKCGLICDLDMHIFENACMLMSKWKDRGYELISISINFSRFYINLDDFAKKLKCLSDKYDIPTNFLKIEITETAVTQNLDKIKHVIDELHSYGFTLSMDDFGSGYSSLGFLDNIMVDEIKLDRSLITNISYNTRTRSIVESVIGMAKKLKVDIVAEGVENLDQLNILKSLNCEVIQGYYCSKPVHCDFFIPNKAWSYYKVNF